MLAQKRLPGRGRFLYISQGSKSKFYSLAVLERTFIIKKDRNTGETLEERPFQSSLYLNQFDTYDEAHAAFIKYKE